SAFAEWGVRPKDRVALLSHNSHAFAAVRFAIARLGAALVPINYMLKPPEIAYILEHSGARLLCIDSSCADNGRAAAAKVGSIEAIMGLPGEHDDEPLAELSFSQFS